jgi:hypothetical protein
MALDRFGCELLALLRDAGVPLTRLAMLGRQHLSVRHSELRALPALASLEGDLDRLRVEGGGFAEPFLRRLGVGDIDSIDYSDYEHCTHVHDLNRPVPAEWHGRYQVVYDGGSLEHVFQFPTALASAMNLVAPGGYYLSGTPSNHFNGHGFYQFSAELFFRIFDQGAGNGFSLPLIAFAESRLGGRVFRIEDPADLRRRVTFSGAGPMLLIVAARRDKVVPLFESNPYQSDYSQQWSGQAESAGKEAARPSLARRLIPASLMQRYDAWRVYQRHDREALLGVHEVANLAGALRQPLVP